MMVQIGREVSAEEVMKNFRNPKKKGHFESVPCFDQLVAGEGFEPSTFGL